MALGKNIKVTLSLDDAGFTQKVAGAREVVKNLEAGLGSFAKSADRLDSTVAGLGSKLDQFGSGLSSVQKQLLTAVESMKKTATGMGQLDQAQQKSVAVAKSTATAVIDSKMQALKAEVETNRQALVSREAYLAKLTTLENEYNAKALAQSIAAENIRRQKKAGSGREAMTEQNVANGYSQSAAVMRQEIAATEALIVATRTEQAARVSNMASLDAERVKALEDAKAKETLARISAAVGKSNAEEMKRVRADALTNQLANDKIALKSAEDFARQKKQYVNEEVATRRAAEQAMVEAARASAAQRARIAAEEAAQARQHAESIGQMWKGMGQLYAGAKIEKGLGASVGAADNMERQRVVVSALNLPKGEEDELYASSAAQAKNLKFISQLDMIKSRMSAIASVGYNNAGIINKTLESAVTAANNLQQLGMAHGDMQSTIRNLYGVVEMRQQTGDAGKTNATFEMLQKIITGTAGKVQTQDMETVLRRMGAGASQVSDSGMYKIAAIVDQFKVAGGEGGGSGGGVSTVGTMIKMFQAYATGKTLSNEAVKQFAGAGIIKDTGIDFSKDDAHVLKDSKHAGLKDADLWMKDPVTAMQSIFPKIIEYTQKKENRAKFYEGRDLKDPEAQMTAFSAYLQRLGITTTAQAGAVVMADPRSKERIDHQTSTMENSKGIKGVDADLQKTYAREMQETKVIISDLAVLVGTQLLPPLKEVLSVVGKVLAGFRDFAKDNPMVVQASAIAAGFVGIGLSVMGAAKVFGLFGSVGSVLRTVTATMLGMRGAATNTVPAMTVFSNSITQGFGRAQLASAFGASAIRTSFMRIGTAVTATAGLVARGFMRMIPLAGQLLLAWDLAGMVANIEVGGVKLITWAIGLGDRMVTAVKNAWLKSKRLFASDDDKIKLTAEIESNDKELEQRLKANGMGAAPPKTEVKKTEGQKAAEKLEKMKPAPEGSNDNQQRIADAAEGGGNKPKRDHVDPLTRALEEAKGKVAANKIALGALKAGVEDISDIRDEVIEELEGKRKAGDFNKDHDANKPVGKDDARYKQLVEETVQLRIQGEQKKALVFANERMAATSYEADAAMERMTGGGIEKQTDAMRALVRELERAEVRLGAGAKGFSEWGAAKSRALFEQSAADVNNFAAGYVNKNKGDSAGLLDTEHARKMAAIHAENEVEDQKYEMLKRTEQERMKSALELATTDKERQDISTQSLKSLDELEVQYSERRRVRAKQDARAMETPVQAMQREWQDTGKAMEDIQANAANNLVSTLSTALTTGRLNVKSFLAGILTDILNANIKKLLTDQFTVGAGGESGNALSWLTGALGKGLTGMFGGGLTGTSVSALTAGDLAGNLSTALPFLSAFAGGGVMTDYGPLELRKYASGGIANSPQLALYGEAGTEAYVPLPDGRSIPVTMTGGATNQAAASASGVSIGIQINVAQDGGTSTSTTGNADEWGKVATKMKDMVQTTIAEEMRPGGLLYK